jgi:tetratricopeptide (TPR) repeat protein
VNTGQAELAERRLEVARLLKPDDYRVHFQMGNAAFRRKEYQNAADRYTKALGMAPSDKASIVEIHTNMGNALMMMHRVPEAVAHYKQALELDPASATTYHNLAFVYSQTGDRASAIQCYQKAVALKPDYVNAWLKLARIYYEDGKYEDALSSLEQAKRAAPDHPQVRQAMEICRKAMASGGREKPQ